MLYFIFLLKSNVIKQFKTNISYNYQSSVAADVKSVDVCIRVKGRIEGQNDMLIYSIT